MWFCLPVLVLLLLLLLLNLETDTQFSLILFNKMIFQSNILPCLSVCLVALKIILQVNGIHRYFAFDERSYHESVQFVSFCFYSHAHTKYARKSVFFLLFWCSCDKSHFVYYSILNLFPTFALFFVLLFRIMFSKLNSYESLLNNQIEKEICRMKIWLFEPMIRYFEIIHILTTPVLLNNKKIQLRCWS